MSCTSKALERRVDVSADASDYVYEVYEYVEASLPFSTAEFD